jgi:S1-C subfamily serine protease
MRIIVFVLLLFGLSKNAFTQVYASRSQLARSIVYLENTSSGITGSGFICGLGNKVFIVTAAHVARQMDFKSIVLLSDSLDNPIPFTIQQLQAYALPSGRWTYHSIADIAIIQIVMSKMIVPYMEKRVIGTEMLYDSLKAPSRDLLLTTFGYPLQLGSRGKVSPLTRGSHPASGLITLPRADDTSILCDFFIMEDPSVGGFSGGPVIDISISKNLAITVTGDGTKIYGIMHGTLSDNTGGKFAAVTPIAYVFDLLKFF